MPGIPCYQIDAFTDRPFGGNPAAVCLLDGPAEKGWMQSVAAEMNLSETAFVCPRVDGFDLRWFTPRVEVDLCGHATLAAAHAVWLAGKAAQQESIPFHTRSGLLTSQRGEHGIELDFPATPASSVEPPSGLLTALGVEAELVAKTRFDYLVVVRSEGAVRSAAPDFRRLVELKTRGVILTAPSDDARYDFVSRFFAPAAGIDEDPVTGSAHCCLGPYWSERFGKLQMTGYQASARGGVVHVRIANDRVILAGHAVTMWRGELMV
jgi:PhzF family phenazine biosynthesis protein